MNLPFKLHDHVGGSIFMRALEGSQGTRHFDLATVVVIDEIRRGPTPRPPRRCPAWTSATF